MSVEAKEPELSDLDKAALYFHRYPTPGKLEIQPTKPLGNQRDLALAYSPGVAAPCLEIKDNPDVAADYTGRANLVARDLQRFRGARARQYRPARGQAGDGRQGGAVQEVCRHRRLRHRDRRARDRAHGRNRRGAGADLRRHQPRGHQGAGVFCGRGAAQGAHAHSRLPRRPARHGDHRRGRGAQRAGARRQEDRRRQDRHVGRGRGGAGLPQPAGRARRKASRTSG